MDTNSNEDSSTPSVTVVIKEENNAHREPPLDQTPLDQTDHSLDHTPLKQNGHSPLDHTPNQNGHSPLGHHPPLDHTGPPPLDQTGLLGHSVVPPDVPSIVLSDNLPVINIPLVVPSDGPTDNNRGDVPLDIPLPKSLPKKIDLTIDGGIIKEILRESPHRERILGDPRSTPNDDANCKFHIKITGEGGFPVYKDTNGNDPLEVVLANEEISSDLEFSLRSMKKGELAHFQIKFEKNTEGSKQWDVPAKTNIEYTIDLIDFQNPPDLGSLITFEAKYEAALQMKNSGNAFYGKNNLVQAIRKYSSAIYIIQEDITMNTQQVRKEILLPCFLNLAVCNLNQKEYQKAISNASKALEIDSHNVKGRWRRGMALMEIGNWHEAERDFLEALDKADKTSKKTITVSYHELKKLMLEQDKKDKENIYQKMFEDKKSFYEDLYKQIESLLSSEPNLLANIANVASVLHEELNKKKSNKINWTGFYFLHKNGDLVLGPFQGKVACTRIGPGKGVCGTAVEKKETLLVPDVHKFEGHIACDSESNSELVVPIIWNNTVVGVLDVDSLVLNGFDNQDKNGLEKIVSLLNVKCNWEHLVQITHQNQVRKQKSRYLWKIMVGGLSTIIISFCVWFFGKDMFFMNRFPKRLPR